MSGHGIIQQALPPYRMACQACGRTWTPTPASGQPTVTPSRLDTVAKAHWKKCPGHPKNVRKQELARERET